MESENKETNTENVMSVGVEAFRKLGMGEEVLSVIKELGFEKPSEIQEKAIPLILDEKDVIGKSSTGSGKTLAFGSGVLERVEALGEIQSIILTPTRELAEQISKALKEFSKFLKIKIACIYGGMDMRTQERALRDADVVVGTPGRTLDHIKRRNFDPSSIELVILDEADRMLEMGMIEDVEEIIGHCPKERQTLLFSATISRDIRRIAERHMIEPIYVEAKPDVDPTKLNQVFYDSPAHKKFSILVHLLRDEKSNLVMVFCNTRRQTDLVADNLKKQGLEARAIHGGLTQSRRNQVMARFHAGETLILVCTDVAARGLDIKGVSHVYNYDAAESPDEYTHRIGRTARAGKKGKAISIVAPRDFSNFRDIMEKFRIQIKKEETPQVEDIRLDMSSSYRSGGRDSSGGRGRTRSGYSRGSSYQGRSGSSGYSRGSSDRGSSSNSSYSRGSSGGSSYSKGSSSRGSRDSGSSYKGSRDSGSSYKGSRDSGSSYKGSSSGGSSYSRDKPSYSKGSSSSGSRDSGSSYKGSSSGGSSYSRGSSSSGSSYSRDKPSYSRDKPSYSRDKPSYSRDKPSYSRDKPSYSRDKPSYSRDKPSYSRGEGVSNPKGSSYSKSSSRGSSYSRGSSSGSSGSYSKERSEGSRDSDKRTPSRRHGSVRRPPRGRSGRSDKAPRYIRSGSSRNKSPANRSKGSSFKSSSSSSKRK